MPTDLPPFAIFFAGALLVPFVRGWPRYVLLLAIPILGAINVAGIPEGFELSTGILGL